jgi:hypothetical protein
MVPAELTAERRDEMIEKTARAVVKRRMETPAVAALEMHKPLATIGSTLVMFLTPIAAPFVTWRRCDELAYFLMDRENIERLCLRIEELARERDAKKAEEEAAA